MEELRFYIANKGDPQLKPFVEDRIGEFDEAWAAFKVVLGAVYNGCGTLELTRGRSFSGDARYRYADDLSSFDNSREPSSRFTAFVSPRAVFCNFSTPGCHDVASASI